jgi:hypothetical protein
MHTVYFEQINPLHYIFITPLPPSFGIFMDETMKANLTDELELQFIE